MPMPRPVRMSWRSSPTGQAFDIRVATSEPSQVSHHRESSRWEPYCRSPSGPSGALASQLSETIRRGTQNRRMGVIQPPIAQPWLCRCPWGTNSPAFARTR